MKDEAVFNVGRLCAQARNGASRLPGTSVVCHLENVGKNGEDAFCDPLPKIFLTTGVHSLPVNSQEQQSFLGALKSFETER